MQLREDSFHTAIIFSRRGNGALDSFILAIATFIWAQYWNKHKVKVSSCRRTAFCEKWSHYDTKLYTYGFIVDFNRMQSDNICDKLRYFSKSVFFLTKAVQFSPLEETSHVFNFKLYKYAVNLRWVICLIHCTCNVPSSGNQTYGDTQGQFLILDQNYAVPLTHISSITSEVSWRPRLLRTLHLN